MSRDLRHTLIAVGTVAAALVAPNAASADDFHVAFGGTDNPTCSAGDPCGLGGALLAAETRPGHDRVVVDGPLQLSGTTLDLETEGDDDVELVGSGTGSAGTIIAAPTGGPALSLGLGQSVSNLSITAPSSPFAVTVYGGTLSDVKITAPNATEGAVQSVAGTIQRSRISAANGTAFRLVAARSTLRDLDISASVGVSAIPTFSGSGPVDIERTRIASTSIGVTSEYSDVNIRDSLLTSAASGATGVNVMQNSHVTISGSTIDQGDGADNGVIVASNDNPGSATILGSIVRGAATDLAIGPILSDTAQSGQITVAASDFATRSASGVTELSGNTGADPLWVDRPGGDYRLQPGSPLIDHGGDEAVTSGETDLAGHPRVLDGDGDGTAARDAGAYETVYVAPPVQPQQQAAAAAAEPTSTERAGTAASRAAVCAAEPARRHRARSRRRRTRSSSPASAWRRPA